MKRSLMFLLLLVSSCFSTATAQQTSEPPPPPKVLLIVREDIKPGLMPAHNRHSENYASMFARLGTDNHRLAMTPVAGSENEVLYLTGAESFADLEKSITETDRRMANLPLGMRLEAERLEREAPELHVNMRDVLAVYRPELSFKPNANIPQMRYFSITTVRVRPGHDAQYVEYVQTVLNHARANAKLPDSFHIVFFQVISGTFSGTYLTFRPMKTMAELDTGIASMVRNSMSDDLKKMQDKVNSEAVLNTETAVYSFQPKMSYMPRVFTSIDAAFWTPATPPAKPRKKLARAAGAKTSESPR